MQVLVVAPVALRIVFNYLYYYFGGATPQCCETLYVCATMHLLQHTHKVHHQVFFGGLEFLWVVNV